MEAAAASQLNGITVVTQAEDSLEWIPAFMFDNPYRRGWDHVACEASHAGMSESIKVGLLHAQSLQAQAVVILLADQPFVTAQLIDHIINMYKNGNKAFIAAGHNGIPRPPVLFDSCMFPDLFRLQGDDGARRIIRDNGGKKGITANWHDGKCFIDIDTQNDYESLLCEETVRWKTTASFPRRILR